MSATRSSRRNLTASCPMSSDSFPIPLCLCEVILHTLKVVQQILCTRRPMCRRRSIELGRCRHSPLRGAQSAAIGDAPVDGFFPRTRVPLRQHFRPAIESRKFPISKFDSGRLAHDCPPSRHFTHPARRGRNNTQHAVNFSTRARHCLCAKTLTDSVVATRRVRLSRPARVALERRSWGPSADQ